MTTAEKSARGKWVKRLSGWALAASLTLVVALAVMLSGEDHPSDPEAAMLFSAPFATPAGITLQSVGKSQGYSLDKQSAAALPRDEFVYADAEGMTLYTFDGGSPGQPNCLAACAESFPPVNAPASAAPFGHWTVIVSKEGTRQWALEGKPLHTYFKDVDPGSIAGNSPAQTGAPRLDGSGRKVGGGFRGAFKGEIPEPNLLPEGWQAAYFFPISDIELPPGVAVREIPDAAAFALVDHRNHTLYLFDYPVVSESDPAWAPFTAPLVARPFGDFGIIDRADGIRQWTWRDRGLYHNTDDPAPGYANGLADGGHGQVAAMYRLFQPAGVTIENTVTKGAVLAAHEGMTLYRRDGHILQSGGGHNLRRGAPARPAVGRDIGTDPRCGESCLDTWRPFLAPADAQSRGFWAVADRADGTRQWVYQGYALWFYSGDTTIGDMFGHDIYDIKLSHDPSGLVDVGTPMDGGAALWWSIAVP